MTTVEKIEKAISLQRALSNVEYRISGDWAVFTNPEDARKYKNVGKVRISDGKVFPASNHTRTSRERDALNFLEIIADAITRDIFPEEDTRPPFRIKW